MSIRTVSVIIPCFNARPRDLRAAVDSVRAERTQLARIGIELDLLLIDDCSDDPHALKTLDQIGANELSCRVVRLEKNGGGSTARNRGVQLSKGQWIAFLDSDDRWIVGGITALAEALAADDSIDWISGDYRYQFDDSPPFEQNVHQSRARPHPLVSAAYERGALERTDRPIESFLEGSLCSMGSCLIRRETFLAAGGFDTRLRKGDDTELYWRLARVATFAFAPWPVFIYRRHAGSVSNDGGSLTDWEPIVLTRMMRQVEWAPHRALLRRRLLNALEQNTVHYRRQRKRIRALRETLTSLSLSPLNRRSWRHLIAVLTVG